MQGRSDKWPHLLYGELSQDLSSAILITEGIVQIIGHGLNLNIAFSFIKYDISFKK